TRTIPIDVTLERVQAGQPCTYCELENTFGLGTTAGRERDFGTQDYHELVSGPANGTLSPGPPFSGVVDYIPNDGFTGLDQVTLRSSVRNSYGVEITRTETIDILVVPEMRRTSPNPQSGLTIPAG